MSNEVNEGQEQAKFINPVFIVSLIICLIIAVWAVVFNENFAVVSGAVLNFLEEKFGWLYLLSVLAFVIFSIAVAASKYGKIKLGDDDSKPEYSTLTWFAMLFGCGMGIGLMFWSVSEPICHMAAPMAGIEAGTDKMYGLKAGMTKEEMRQAIRNERRMELAFEEHRYFDIRRWREAENIYKQPLKGMQITSNGVGETYIVANVLNVAWDNKRYFYPIPYTEVNKNDNMVQNPNW